MRKINLLVIFIVAVLSGCSGDEERMPIGVGMGDYPAECVTFTANGRKVSIPFTASLEKTGDLLNSTYEGEVVLRTAVLKGTAGTSPETMHLEEISPVLQARSTDTGMILEGVVDSPGGIVIDIRGVVTASSDGRKTLDVYADYRNDASPLVGRTFEMDFDDESIFPVIEAENTRHTLAFGDETFTPSEVALTVFREMNKCYVENSGWSGARLTFNPDCTVDLHFRKSDTGEYVKSDGIHRYLATEDVVFFVDGADFLSEQSRCYDMPPTVTGLDMPSRQLRFGSVAGVMNMMYGVSPDGTLRMEWVPTFGYHYPKLTWYRTEIVGGPTSRIQFLVNSFINIVPEHLEIRPTVMAHEI